MTSLSALDGLHIVERMKSVLRELSSDIRTDPDARNVVLAEKGFSAADINAHSYAAAAAIGVEQPAQEAIDALARAAADAYGKRGNGTGIGASVGTGGSGGTTPSKVTEADEWDRIANAVITQRDAMNERTKAVSDHMTRLADALINHGHGLRSAHADRMAEASDCESMIDNLEKKYSKTVAGLAPTKG